MTKFTQGFEKTAKGKPKLSGWDKTWKKIKDGAGGLKKGVTESGDVALKEHLNPMTGFRAVRDAFDSTKNKTWAQKARSVGKGLPSLAATGTYAYGAKKVIDGISGGSDNQNNNNTMTNYYGY